MYAVIEGGIVVGLSETDLTTYTDLQVVQTEEAISVGDAWDGMVFTPAAGPEIEIPAGSTSDVYVFDTNNYVTQLEYHISSASKRTLLKIVLLEAVGGGIQWSTELHGQSVNLNLSSDGTTFRIQNQSVETLTFYPVSEVSVPKP